MKKIFLLPVAFLLILVSCSLHSNNKTTGKTINRAWLDSIIKNSDSNYTKPYKRTDFVTAVYYMNKKDSSVCQLMKDSADSVRQIIIAKKNIRTFFAQYFPNGNLQADLPLDEFGQFHGKGTFYNEDGSIQSSGNYVHGLKSGTWTVYDKKGKITATDSYDNNGNLVPQKQP